MLKLGSFPFMPYDSTPISNLSSAGLILVMLVHNIREKILAPGLQTEEWLGGTRVAINLLQWLDHQRSAAFSLWMEKLKGTEENQIADK